MHSPEPSPLDFPALPDKLKHHLSASLLVAANLIPLIGVLFWNWNTFSLLILFWAENVLIGLFNILKMAANRPTEITSNLGKLFMIPFFAFHYGMFTLVHGIFVCSMLGKDELGQLPGHGLFGYVPEVARYFALTGLIWGLFCLALSHGASFLLNYIGRGEYRRVRLDALMAAPYGRVVVLHVTILFGGMLVMALGSPIWALALLVVLKTGFDLLSHELSHKKLA